MKELQNELKESRDALKESREQLKESREQLKNSEALNSGFVLTMVAMRDDMKVP